MQRAWSQVALGRYAHFTGRMTGWQRSWYRFASARAWSSDAPFLTLRPQGRNAYSKDSTIQVSLAWQRWAAASCCSTRRRSCAQAAGFKAGAGVGAGSLVPASGAGAEAAAGARGGDDRDSAWGAAGGAVPCRLYRARFATSGLAAHDQARRDRDQSHCPPPRAHGE